MPLKIIHGDVTALSVDAIVNAANSRLQRGSGVCGAIFARADGKKLQAACDQIGSCPTGGAVITPSFGLPAPYVIHAVGPIWLDGTHGEEALLRSAYICSLNLARDNHLHSVAFPLISSGIYGYPRHQALTVALSAIGDWLDENEAEMTAYLVLFDRAEPEVRSALHQQIQAYILANFKPDPSAYSFCAAPQAESLQRYITAVNAAPAPDAFCDSCSEPEEASSIHSSLDDLLSQAGESFSAMLFRLIDERGLTDPQVYRRANLDRKLFSKIRSNPQYQPSKNTVLALAIALELTLEQTAELLQTAGYALSPSSKSDLIIRFFISEHQYSIHQINETLYSFNQRLLGA